MWHGVVKDVHNMVTQNRKMTTGAPQLHPVPVKEPWYMVGIDFVGPLSPQAEDGCRLQC